MEPQRASALPGALLREMDDESGIMSSEAVHASQELCKLFDNTRQQQA